MSAVRAMHPITAPVRRALRRGWLRYRIWSAERDRAGLVSQMRKDRAQARAYRRQAGTWRVELALLEDHQ